MKPLEFHDIHRTFGIDHEALSGVTFSVDPGTVVGQFGRQVGGEYNDAVFVAEQNIAREHCRTAARYWHLGLGG